MNRDDILAMKPGEELDATVAEKVVGSRLHWERAVPVVVRHGVRIEWVECDASRGELRRREDGSPIPHYSTDIAAAWEVVEHMQTHNWTFDLQRHAVDVGKEHGWEAKFGRLGYARAMTAPEAICKAALLAVLEGTS